MDFSRTRIENLLQITIQLKTKLFHFNVVLVDVNSLTIANCRQYKIGMRSVSINPFPD